MKAIEFVAEVDDRHCLQIALPASVPSGKLRVIVLIPEPEEAEAGEAWMNGVSNEWAEELLDSRQDIYSLADGEPVPAAQRR